MTNKLTERATALLTIPQVAEIYHSKSSEAEAKQWLLDQALITLMYSHEERMKMAAKK